MGTKKTKSDEAVPATKPVSQRATAKRPAATDTVPRANSANTVQVVDLEVQLTRQGPEFGFEVGGVFTSFRDFFEQPGQERQALRLCLRPNALEHGRGSDADKLIALAAYLYANDFYLASIAVAENCGDPRVPPPTPAKKPERGRSSNTAIAKRASKTK